MEILEGGFHYGGITMGSASGWAAVYVPLDSHRFDQRTNVAFGIDQDPGPKSVQVLRIDMKFVFELSDFVVVFFVPECWVNIL